MMYTETNTSSIKETDNEFEVLCTRRTVNDRLASIQVEDAGDGTKRYIVYGAPGSDFIIHILPSEEEPEEYMHIKSGNVVKSRKFMYTNRYLRCRIRKDGSLQAII